MRTHRIADPFPRGTPRKKLEWGSSAWAADSCLVEWSRLEREWLDPQPAERPRTRARAADRTLVIPDRAWLWLMIAALVLVACFWGPGG
jgi:hypothetical protein